MRDHHRAAELGLQEAAGRRNARLNSAEARKRADLLQGRLQKRLEDLKLEAQMWPLPPVMEIDCQLGFEPVDREVEKLGYDAELIARAGRPR